MMSVAMAWRGVASCLLLVDSKNSPSNLVPVPVVW